MSILCAHVVQWWVFDQCCPRDKKRQIQRRQDIAFCLQEQTEKTIWMRNWKMEILVFQNMTTIMPTENISERSVADKVADNVIDLIFRVVWFYFLSEPDPDTLSGVLEHSPSTHNPVTSLWNKDLWRHTRQINKALLRNETNWFFGILWSWGAEKQCGSAMWTVTPLTPQISRQTISCMLTLNGFSWNIETWINSSRHRDKTTQGGEFFQGQRKLPFCSRAPRLCRWHWEYLKKKNLWSIEMHWTDSLWYVAVSTRRQFTIVTSQSTLQHANGS